MKSKGKIRLLPLCMVLLLLVMTGCNQNSGKKDSEQNAKTVIPPLATATGFANYNEKAVDCSPSVEPYTVDPGLGNITNRDMFEFSAEAKRLLVENGFVVMPGSDREFFMLYEINSYEPIPSFITTDSMLHNYHLFFSHLLRVIEKEKLAIELEELTEAMLLETKNQYKTLKGTDWENAALRNLGFFAVAGKLLNPEIGRASCRERV